MQKGITFVLVHSPLVGHYTWSPVGSVLRSLGYRVVIPTLTDSEVLAAPYWQQHTGAVAEALADIPVDRLLVLVGHSGAGPLLPAIRAALPHAIAAYVFVDAGLPRNNMSRLDLLAAESPSIAKQFREILESDGRFPTWNDEQLQPLIPDADRRHRLLAELRPRAKSFFTEPLPVFAAWPDAPCAYVQFSPAYDGYAEYARQSAWLHHRIEAGHFHMLVDPIHVAEVLVQLVRQLSV